MSEKIEFNEIKTILLQNVIIINRRGQKQT